jgi:hypothetical protein
MIFWADFTPNFAALHSGLLPVLPLAKELSPHCEEFIETIFIYHITFNSEAHLPEGRQSAKI